jgi:hypothetical protein
MENIEKLQSSFMCYLAYVIGKYGKAEPFFVVKTHQTTGEKYLVIDGDEFLEYRKIIAQYEHIHDVFKNSTDHIGTLKP